MELDYQEACDKLKEWVKECVVEVRLHAAEYKAPDVSTHSGSVIPTDQHVVYTISVGDALMWFSTRQDGQHHQPIIVVTERNYRSHRIGVGHQHVYEALVSGHPNVKKAVKNMLTRYQEIVELGGVVAVKETNTKMSKHLAKQELQGVRVPPEMTVSRCNDGTYAIHISTARVTISQLRDICSTMSKR